jgi:ABC-2 type transport system ATP-binding protein
VSAPALAVERIAKRFGDLEAVRDLSFEVRPGEIFGFLGPNGAGKTTTLRMLMGITAPDSGTVRYGDDPALDRAKVGYLPEERGLFEDTPVLETLAYLGELRGMARGDALASARTWLDRLGLAGRMRDRVGALSKGNQQKVQFAGAILHGPDLAVLDEPFSGLDPINQEVISGLMRELRAQGTAVLLSAHQLDLVERLADRFLLISRGRAVLRGSLDEMRQQAAGGRDELVRLRLAPRERPLEAGGVRTALQARIGGSQMETREDGEGGLILDVQLSPGTDLTSLLTAAGGLAAILAVETRRVPLHEIYLRAVTEAGDVVREEEVTAHG